MDENVIEENLLRKEPIFSTNILDRRTRNRKATRHQRLLDTMKTPRRLKTCSFLDTRKQQRNGREMRLIKRLARKMQVEQTEEQEFMDENWIKSNRNMTLETKLIKPKQQTIANSQPK